MYVCVCCLCGFWAPWSETCSTSLRGKTVTPSLSPSLVLKPHLALSELGTVWAFGAPVVFTRLCTALHWWRASLSTCLQLPIWDIDLWNKFLHRQTQHLTTPPCVEGAGGWGLIQNAKGTHRRFKRVFSSPASLQTWIMNLASSVSEPFKIFSRVFRKTKGGLAFDCCSLLERSFLFLLLHKQQPSSASTNPDITLQFDWLLLDNTCYYIHSVPALQSHTLIWLGLVLQCPEWWWVTLLGARPYWPQCLISIW